METSYCHKISASFVLHYRDGRKGGLLREVNRHSALFVRTTCKVKLWIFNIQVSGGQSFREVGFLQQEDFSFLFVIKLKGLGPLSWGIETVDIMGDNRVVSGV